LEVILLICISGLSLRPHSEEQCQLRHVHDAWILNSLSLSLSLSRNDYLSSGASHNVYNRTMRLTFFLSGCEVNKFFQRKRKSVVIFHSTVGMNCHDGEQKNCVHAELPVQNKLKIVSVEQFLQFIYFRQVQAQHWCINRNRKKVRGGGGIKQSAQDVEWRLAMNSFYALPHHVPAPLYTVAQNHVDNPS
jgi:hypothetical protein